MTHDWLPQVLAEIAGVAGLDAALALAAARGGIEVYIPRRASDRHWLTEVVGYEAAQAICRWRPAERIMVPLGPTGSAAATRAQAGRMIAEGRSTSEIARACGISSRSVERKRAQTRRSDDRQGNLF